MTVRDSNAPQGRDQPWADDPPDHGRVVVVTDNPVSRALAQICELAGRRTTVLVDEYVEPTPLEWLRAHPLEERDVLVLCAHDTPDVEALLRHGLEGEVGYVAMLGSRNRAAALFAELTRIYPAATLARLQVPAGLDIGGKAPGEMALSIAAEIVAHSYGRPGGPMKTG